MRGKREVKVKDRNQLVNRDQVRCVAISRDWTKTAVCKRVASIMLQS